MAIELYQNQQVSQIGRCRLQHCRHINPQALIEAIESPGEILKRSSKNETRLVGEWVVKKSRFEGGLGPLKRTLARGRYRQAWRAANHLHMRGVRVPQPLAYAEWAMCGIIFGNATVTKFLDGCVNVEVFAAKLAVENNPRLSLDEFFAGLASAVNRLAETGAYHADLSGKNIFTRDGQQFHFIDLDGVSVGLPYTDARRLKNQVQLYDSFCDFCNHETLAEFHALMLPEKSDYEEWMRAIVRAQKARRRRHVSRR